MKKILVVSLTNIGDIVLTFPVIDILREDFPGAELSVVIGPKGETLLKGNPSIERTYLFDKQRKGLDALRWVLSLRGERFDLCVDLRNSAIPFLVGARRATAPFLKRDPREHMREQHLRRLRSVHPFERGASVRRCLYFSPADRAAMDEHLRGRPGTKGWAAVAPGAADVKKRWSADGFAKVCDALVRDYGLTPVFLGDAGDRSVVQDILSKMRAGDTALDLCGRATLAQSAYVISRCSLAVTNDSAPMHLASYLDVPVVAVFGPTDPARYGPWGRYSGVLKESAQSVAGPIMNVEAKDVLEKVPQVYPGSVSWGDVR